MDEQIDKLKAIADKLKTIEEFQTKDEAFLINQYILVCEDMVEKNIVPENGFFDGMDKVLDLYNLKD